MITLASESAIIDAALPLVGPKRSLLGIAGPPGAGKSTFAQWLVSRLNEACRTLAVAYLPMDGFHLSNVALDAVGLTDRKGSPASFDGVGFLALLQRLADDTTQTIYAPDYSRTLHEPIAASIAIVPTNRLIIVEGNYLLLPDEPWAQASRLFAEIWFIEQTLAICHARLVDRQLRSGKSPEEAEHWFRTNDELNWNTVSESKATAKRIIDAPLQN